MFKFGATSIKYLNSVDKRLKILAEKVLSISPIDFLITEGLRTKEIQEQLFYKEFLLYLHNLEYKKAKELIANTAAIANTPKVRQAKRFTKTWLHFLAAHFIKEYKYKKELNKRV